MANEKKNEQGPRSWYRFSAQADPAKAELYVYDYLGVDPWTGEGIGAKQFIDELNALPESVTDVTVHVNSGGGSVFDAVPIANALREHRAAIHMRIDGLAASAATIVTMAGDTITIAENALVMIHQPWSIIMGAAKDMRAEAEALDRVTSAIIATYQWHSTLDDAQLTALMDATTWMDAEEAVFNGFATDVGASMKAAAHVDQRLLSKLGAIPEKYQARFAELTEEKKPEDPPVDPAPVDPPVDPPAPEPIVADPAASTNVIDFEKAKAELRTVAKGEARQEERARVSAIVNAAKTIGLAQYGADLAAEGLEIEAARERLFAKLAADGPEIVSLVDPVARAADQPAPRISVTNIYEQRKQQRETANGQRRS